MWFEVAASPVIQYGKFSQRVALCHCGRRNAVTKTAKRKASMMTSLVWYCCLLCVLIYSLATKLLSICPRRLGRRHTASGPEARVDTLGLKSDLHVGDSEPHLWQINDRQFLLCVHDWIWALALMVSLYSSIIIDRRYCAWYCYSDWCPCVHLIHRYCICPFVFSRMIMQTLSRDAGTQAPGDH